MMFPSLRNITLITMVFAASTAAAAQQSGTYAYASAEDYVGGWEVVIRTDGARSYTSSTQSTAFTSQANAAGSSSADLMAGTVRAFASSRIGGVARGEAAWRDVLTFSVAGADASTLTRLRLTHSFRGDVTRSSASSVSAVGQLLFGGTGFTGFVGNPNSCSVTALGFGGTACLVYRASGLENFVLTRPDDSLLLFRGDFVFRVDRAIVPVYSTMQLLTVENAVLNFNNTSRFSFVLPSNVSFISASGVFLSVTPVLAAVPEPSTWAMMLLGFFGIGVAMRSSSKRRTKIMHV